MRTGIIMIGLLFLAACTNPDCRKSSIDPVSIDLSVLRIEKELFVSNSPNEVKQVLENYPAFAELFLHSTEYPNLDLLANKIYGLTKDTYMDTLYREVKSEFADFSKIENDLKDAIGRMQSLFPESKIPKIETVVTGLYRDLYVSDSLVIVGLDFFIGDKASYPPANIPKYILSRYDKEHLASTVVQFLSSPYVSKGKNETMISEMIDFGKSLYLLSRLMPCTQDSIIMGYSPKELQTVLDNEAIIWANFVENEVLYTTSHLTKRKFLGERPNVYEISQECPGRVGAWVGWRIVEAYMSNNRVEIKDLISERDNDKIFRLSGYKPKG